MTAAVAWVNAQPDWAPVEVVGGALDTITRFPWGAAGSRALVEPSG